MSAMSDDLIEFLRARLDDDCAVIADPSVPGNESCQLSNGPRREYWSKERALAEVDSKRRIIEMHEIRCDSTAVEGNKDEVVWCATCNESGYCLTVRLLALPYAGHPDYRPEWAPR